MKIPKYKLLKKKKTLHKKAWGLYSIYRRSSEADFQGYVECYTCLKKIPWQEAHLGHFLHGKLDFDTRNTKIQCCGCNTFKDGNLGEYAQRLIEENGLEWLKQLKKDAVKGNDYSIEELEDIINVVTKLKNLKWNTHQNNLRLKGDSSLKTTITK